MANDEVLRSLVAGGVAGTCTDLVFFPIDTIKTRLQAKGGFFKNGGRHGIYQGVGSTIVASAPGAALFFMCYDFGKRKLPEYTWFKDRPAAIHMVSASVGEIVACSIRVPSEVVKQRVQTGQHGSSWVSLKNILSNATGEGVFRGLYRGYFTTVMREIPFTMIQFPLYEGMKTRWAAARGVKKVDPLSGALCGSIAGGIAAAATTPLDVLKTRLMLNKNRETFGETLREIHKDGFGTFFRGVVPRTLWISAGGAVFLGMYEVASSLLYKDL